tara:strand:- start:7 stop:177 length:171 start_codon:yes stop_codon:yes gene_type:complete
MKEAKKIKPRKQRKPTKKIELHSFTRKKKIKIKGWPEDLRFAEPSSRELIDANEES